MNKLAPFFIATALVLCTGAFAEDDAASPDPSAKEPSQPGQDVETKGFVVIQRNIYVPVDSEGNVASSKWVVIDKQGFVTAEELEAAQQPDASGAESESGDNGNQPSEGTAQPALPKAEKPQAGSTRIRQKRQSIGEGPMVRS